MEKIKRQYISKDGIYIYMHLFFKKLFINSFEMRRYGFYYLKNTY